MIYNNDYVRKILEKQVFLLNSTKNNLNQLDTDRKLIICNYVYLFKSTTYQ